MRFCIEFDKAFDRMFLLPTVKPLIAYSSPNVDAIVGRDVKLTCVVLQGNPTPRIAWTKMGEPVTTSDRVIDDHKGNLLFKHVQVDEEGEYVCTASNVGGSASNTIRLDVQGNLRKMHISYVFCPGLRLVICSSPGMMALFIQPSDK